MTNRKDRMQATMDILLVDAATLLVAVRLFNLAMRSVLSLSVQFLLADFRFEQKVPGVIELNSEMMRRVAFPRGRPPDRAVGSHEFVKSPMERWGARVDRYGLFPRYTTTRRVAIISSRVE